MSCMFWWDILSSATPPACETNCLIYGPTAVKSSGNRNCRLIKQDLSESSAAWHLGAEFTLCTMKYSQLQRSLLSKAIHNKSGTSCLITLQLETVSGFPTRQEIKPLSRKSHLYCSSALVSLQQGHLHNLPDTLLTPHSWRHSLRISACLGSTSVLKKDSRLLTWWNLLDLMALYIPAL